MQEEAKKAVSEMRYGKGDYFWINNTKPAMVMHPIKPALNGKDLSNFKDPNGVYLFKEMVSVSQKDGEGLVKYAWPKPGKDTPQPKFSYVQLFKPWGWIIGTGAYVDDIEDKISLMNIQAQQEINDIIQTIILSSLALAIVLISIVIFLSDKIIIKPLRQFQDGLLHFFKFLNKETQKSKPLQESDDEIGTMAKVINENIKKTKQLMIEDQKLLANVKEVVALVQDGKIDQKITRSTQNQSLEELKSLINSMLKTLSQKVVSDVSKLESVLESYQKLDFRTRVDDSGKTAQGLNTLADIINKMLIENKANGLTLDSSSAKLLENVSTLNRNSTESAAALEETASSLEEISSNIKDDTEHIIQMAELAKTLTKSANKGNQLATKTIQSMEDLDQQVNAINEAITVIDQIAFQTNILSLNAAVEAATAGEAGKGFAVVAQEVRNLAGKSAEAAKEIKDLVENATAKADEGKSIATDMINGYDELNNNITNTAGLIADIENASKEQLIGIEQVNDAVSSLDMQTQSNVRIANEAYEIALKTDKLATDVVKDADEKEFIGKNEVEAKRF